jgi:thiazole/oxazole-forming peptide maturase SagD family component
LSAAAAAARFMAEDPEDSPTPGGAATHAAEILVGEIRIILERPLPEWRLLDHVLAVNGAAASTSLHRVIPMPWCPVCGGAAAMERPSPQPSISDRSSPAELLAQLAGWVDRKTGVIARIAVDHADAPVTMTAAPPHIASPDGSLRQLPVGWGKGLTLSTAILSTVGETIERYSASLPDPSRIVWKRPSELEGDVLDPASFALYAPDQYARTDFPYVRFDRNVPHPWVAGHWLGGGGPVWAPAAFVFLVLSGKREHQIAQGTSNGLAAGADSDDASLRAVLELVERDAFFAAWIAGRAGRRIAFNETLPAELRGVMDAIRAFGAQVELYRLETAACGTAILALALGDGDEYPGVTIGLGADLDPAVALRQAILELGQTGPHLRRLMRTRTVTAPAEPRRVREMLDHAAFYFPRDRAVVFDRIRGMESPVALSEVMRQGGRRSLASCAAALEQAGVRVALVDVTSPDVALSPFRVVRAVSPDLQSISYGYGCGRIPVERIRRMGVAADVPEIHPIW